MTFQQLRGRKMLGLLLRHTTVNNRSPPRKTAGGVNCWHLLQPRASWRQTTKGICTSTNVRDCSPFRLVHTPKTLDPGTKVKTKQKAMTEYIINKAQTVSCFFWEACIDWRVGKFLVIHYLWQVRGCMSPVAQTSLPGPLTATNPCIENAEDAFDISRIRV